MTAKALDLGTLSIAGAASTIFRSLIVYVAVLAALRLAGKRHVGQLSIVDFVLVLLVSNAVQNAMVGNDSSVAGGLVAAFTLIVVNLLLTRFVLRHERFGAFLEGEPTLLVRNGRVLDGHLAREGIRRVELEAAPGDRRLDQRGPLRRQPEGAPPADPPASPARPPAGAEARTVREIGGWRLGIG